MVTYDEMKEYTTDLINDKKCLVNTIDSLSKAKNECLNNPASFHSGSWNFDIQSNSKVAISIINLLIDDCTLRLKLCNVRIQCIKDGIESAKNMKLTEEGDIICDKSKTS